MTADDSFGRLDDDDYPAYTMGRAAEMLGTTQGFLRALGEAHLITPLRSAGGHRRYSRYQLRIAARARELVDQGTPIEAACRIIILEDQLEEAQRINAEYRRAAESANRRPRPEVSVPAASAGTARTVGGVTACLSYGDRGVWACSVCVSCRGSEVPFAHAFGVGVLLCCAAGTRAITSAFRMAWEAFIDWKA